MVYVLMGCGFACLLISIYFFVKAHQIQNINNEQLKHQERNYKESIFLLQSEYNTLINNINTVTQSLNNEKDNLIKIQKQKAILQQELSQTINKQQTTLKTIQTNAQYALSQYEKNLDSCYQKKEKIITEELKQIQEQKEQAINELTQLKTTIQAATAARLREQEWHQKLFFYRIQLTDQQCSDINQLLLWKSKLYDPSIVSKIIWSAYILKPTSDLCNRVLGSKTVCGIYKITNHTTGQIYIGQSVNIADRWKAHIKCGLGIDASSTNKLYNNMQHYMVWNFTFELLQECPKDKLNKKEQSWIDWYHSDKVGLNSTRGNKT